MLQSPVTALRLLPSITLSSELAWYNTREKLKFKSFFLRERAKEAEFNKRNCVVLKI